MFVLNGYFAPPVTNALYSVSPSTAQSKTASTTTNSQGASSYTVSGLGTTAVNIALFPCTAAGAPSTTNATTTFPPATANTAGPTAGEGATDSNPDGALVSGNAKAGETQGTIAAGTATGYIASVNGVPTTNADGETVAYGVTPTNGTVSFVVNSFMPDCATPVVYTAPSSAGTNPALLVNANGTPQTGYAFGIGGSTTWSAVAAAAGTYDNYVVQSVNPTADTFQAKGAAGSFTFTYGQSGSSYSYDETPGVNATTSALPISEGEFASYLSGAYPGTAATATTPATPPAAGDELNIAYGGASNPGVFAFDGESTQTSGTEANGDVPAAPTGATATFQAAVTSGTGAHPAGVLVSWTAPPNPDVVAYQVQYATYNSSGVLSAFTDAGNGYSVSSTGVYTQNITAGFVAGTQSADGVETAAPATSFFDPNQSSGAKVVYRVIAYADANNGNATATCVQAALCKTSPANAGEVGQPSPASADTATVTVPTVAAAQVTGPLTTSTSFANPNTSTSLASGETIDLNFNTPVSVASSWSVEIADTAGDIGLLDSANTLASVANGGLTVILTIGQGTTSGAVPVVVAKAAPSTSDGPWEVLTAAGIDGTGTGTPAYNVEASGAGTGKVMEGTTTVSVTREVSTTAGGTETTNSGLPTAPTVTVYGSSASSTPNTFTSTCAKAGDSLNVYNAAGSLLGSVTCTATTATSYSPPTGVTFTSGDTYIVGVSTGAAPAYASQESGTAVALAQ